MKKLEKETLARTRFTQKEICVMIKKFIPYLLVAFLSASTVAVIATAADNHRGQGLDDIFITQQKLVADLLAVKTAFLDHRHSVAGDTDNGTAPSTSGETAGATASTITLTASSE